MGESMRRASLEQDGDKIALLSKAIHANHNEVDGLYEHLEGLYQDRETKEAEFNRQIDALNTV